MQHSNLINNLVYIISKYVAFGMFIIKRDKGVLLIEGKKYYIPNPNGVGIFNKTKSFTNLHAEIFRIIDLYVDVGAHFGDNIVCVKDLNTNVQVLAFEPNSESLVFLKKNTSHFNNLHIYDIALGSKNEEKPIYYDEDHLDTASLNMGADYLLLNSKKPIQNKIVKVKALDSFIEFTDNKHAIYLKIDVETFENEVLLGAKDFIKYVKYLEVEWFQTEANPISKLFAYLQRPFTVEHCSVTSLPKPHNGELINVLVSFV